MNKFLLLLVSFVIAYSSITGQGIIRGKISDENGVEVIGASVYLKGTSIGTTTNLNGDYTIKITVATPQILVVSSIEYITIEEEVNLKNGEVLVRNYILKTKTQELNEVVVTGRANRSNENTIRTIKSKSAVSIDYISSETIKKIGDSNVASALSRVPGVSTNGSFFTVRGIGDRYVKTTINGARIPTLDPFTNNIKLDLFPASLIDNIILSKTASPDLPGDWAGAYMSIETKDYPEKLSINVETSFGYNNQTTFKDVLSSERSKTDWLGFDNGLRDIDVDAPVGHPALATATVSNSKMYLGILGGYFTSMGVTPETPWSDELTKLALIQLGFLGPALKDDESSFNAALTRFNSNEGGYKQQGLNAAYKEYVEMARKLPNNWMSVKRKAPLDFSQSFSIGNQTLLFGKPLGFIFGFRYSSSLAYDPNVDFVRSKLNDEQVKTNNLDDLKDLLESYGEREYSSETNNISGLINLAYNFNPNHSITIMFMPNLIGVNRVTKSDNYDPFYALTDKSQFINYESRKQLVYQVKSEHYFKGPKLKIDFNLSFTNGSSKAPDNKAFFNYSLESSSSYNFYSDPHPMRTFRYLTENLLDARINAELPFGNNQDRIRKLRFGGSYLDLYRFGENITYFIDVSNEGFSFSDPTTVFDIGNFEPTIIVPKYAYSSAMGGNANTLGFNQIKAIYAMVDYEFFPKLRFTGGVRVENSKMHTDLGSFYYAKYSFNDARRGITTPFIADKTVYLPSVNLLYRLNQTTEAPVNLRLNYSQSVARPSLRETTNFKTYDFSLNSYIIGNTNLKTVLIDNYDFRFESFFKNGDFISTSLFYKVFLNHIEFIDKSRWQNTGESNIKGIELEGRKKITTNLSVLANITFVRSLTTNIVQMFDTINRAMYGQSPYVINGMLAYNSDKLGLSAAISYNYQGEKLIISSSMEYPDIYELPRHLVDIKISKNAFKHFVITLKCRDLLNTSLRTAYKYSVGWVDYEKYTYGTSYILSVSYKL